MFKYYMKFTQAQRRNFIKTARLEKLSEGGLFRYIMKCTAPEQLTQVCSSRSPEKFHAEKCAEYIHNHI